MRVEINCTYDGATPLLQYLNAIGSRESVRLKTLEACVNMTKNYIRSMPPNKRGWPSQGFWGKAADGTFGELTNDGFHILIDNEDAPGAMAFKHFCHVNGSGEIHMKDKLLTIPANAPYYGHRAGEFSNLRFVQFGPGGAKALVVGKEGEGKVNFGTGRSYNRAGLGAGRSTRLQMIIAYWLVEAVTQHQATDVIPSVADYISLIDQVFRRAMWEDLENAGFFNQ